MAAVSATGPEFTPIVVSPIRLSWGAVFGGVFVALGVWILLVSFGLAAGLSAVDPNSPASVKGASLGTGVWAAIVPLIALFVGGIVAGRTAGIIDRLTGAIHGAVLWGFATIVTLMLVGSAVGGVVRTVFEATSQIAGAAVGATAATSAREGGGVMQGLGIDMNDVLGPVNQKLQSEGKPPITAAELQAATRDVAQTAVRTGRLDRGVLVTSVARETSLSRADAEDLADRIETSFNAQKRETATDARTVALRAMDATGKAMWWVSLGLLLGLGASIAGATVGVTRRQRRAARGVPLATTREVHP